MDRREREALDDHITGHGGEDQLRDDASDDQPIRAKWLTSLVDGYEFILANDETADRQYLLESLIGDLRGLVKAAQAV